MLLFEIRQKTELLFILKISDLCNRSSVITDEVKAGVGKLRKYRMLLNVLS